MEQVLGIVNTDGIIGADGIDQGNPAGLRKVRKAVTQPIQCIKNTHVRIGIFRHSCLRERRY
jgi:hypothetical protein